MVGAQRTLLQDLARAYGWEVVGLYEDDGVSGMRALTDRPAGARLLADARRPILGNRLLSD